MRICSGADRVTVPSGGSNSEPKSSCAVLPDRPPGRPAAAGNAGFWVADGVSTTSSSTSPRASSPARISARRSRRCVPAVDRLAERGRALPLRIAGRPPAPLGVRVPSRRPTTSRSSSNRHGRAATAGLRLGHAERRHFVGLGARHCVVVRPGRADASSSGPTAAIPARTARRSSSPRAASRRATAHRCRGSSRAGDTRSGPRPSERDTASSWARSASASRPGRCRPAAAPRALRADARPPGCGPTAGCTGFAPVLPEWGYGFWKSRDFHEHRDDVYDDFDGCRAATGSRSTRSCSTRPGRRSTTPGSSTPISSPTPTGWSRSCGAAGVRTVVWTTPWVNLDSTRRADPAPAGVRAPAPGAGRRTTRPAAAGRPLRPAGADGEPFVDAMVDGHRLAGRLHQPGRRGVVARAGQAAARLGVEGIKADDGDGYYIPDDVRFADGRTRGQAAWGSGGMHRRSHAARARRGPSRARRAVRPLRLDRPAGDRDDLGRRPGVGLLVAARAGGRDAAGGGERVLELVRTTSAATSATAWSIAARRSCSSAGLQFGGFTPLMHAHGTQPQEPWTYDARVLDIYRAYVVLHERLVPYVRAAAATARADRAADHPAALPDRPDRRPRAGRSTDAYGYGPSLWVAPVSTTAPASGRSPFPAETGSRPGRASRSAAGARRWPRRRSARIPVWVRPGSIVVTYPADHVAAGLGDVPESERPLEATLWGEPPLGQASVQARRRDANPLDRRDAGRSTPTGRSRSRREVSDPTGSRPASAKVGRGTVDGAYRGRPGSRRPADAGLRGAAMTLPVEATSSSGSPRRHTSTRSDRAATAALKAIPYLDRVVRKLIELGYERALRQSYLGSAVRLGEHQLPDVGRPTTGPTRPSTSISCRPCT